jgi:integrase
MMHAYHGFRLGEISEASTLDIEEEDGIPVIWIRLKSRPKTMRIKTDSSKRRVAIHSACLSAGFLAYVERVKAHHGDGLAVQPPLDGERGHSWRHTVATLMEDAGVPDARNRYICGHAPRDKHARYLHHAAAKLREAIECVPTV